MSLGSDYLNEMYVAMAGNEERQRQKANDILESGWETAKGHKIPIKFIECGHLINIICYLEATNELDSNAEIIAIMESELQRREIENG